MTSNCSEEFYRQMGYDQMLEKYQQSLNTAVGPTKMMICADTLQVNDYSKYNWTMFNPQKKIQRHQEVFPDDLKKAFLLGSELIENENFY